MVITVLEHQIHSGATASCISISTSQIPSLFPSGGFSYDYYEPVLYWEIGGRTMTLYDIPKSFFWQKLFLWPLLSIAFFIIMLIVNIVLIIRLIKKEDFKKQFNQVFEFFVERNSYSKFFVQFCSIF